MATGPSAYSEDKFNRLLFKSFNLRTGSFPSSALNNENDNIILVGDRIHTDIEIGKKIGAKTILVCSGEFKNTKHEVNKIKDTEIYNTLSDFLKTL